MATRIGVDVGGTFTDLVFYDDATGEVLVGKGSSTPGEPDRGVLNTVRASVSPDLLRQAEYFLHGTTVGLNALIERNGARVGLLSTAGFRDVLELRRGDRGEMYDLLWQAEPALVPRRLRRPVVERMRADGTVETPLDVASVEAAVAAFQQEGVEAVAVCFINAYANPAHELAAERALRQFGFEGEISLGHRLSGEYREYERTSTTVIDAYVRPAVSSYIGRLERELKADGFAGGCLITRSGGGSLFFAEAGERPFETLMSGPVAGAVGAGTVCSLLGYPLAITADVGGTSFDTCLVVDGRPTVKYQGFVGDMPLQTAWVDVRSIGAGGGSIAYVDEGDLLRVGPRSAGAAPGPVCYGRGGTEPTTTDAAAVLGMLAFGELADGVRLDVAAAGRAVDDLGARLGLDRDETASGIMTIAAAAMAAAINAVSLEQGEDPRAAALVAFGGAGPLFATLLASALDMRTVVVPRHAGNFSAWGLLGQDVTRTASVTLIAPLGDAGLDASRTALERLFAELAERTTDDGLEAVREAALDMRYVQQDSTITVDWRPDDDAASLTQRFTAQHERTFGHRVDAPVEIVSVRATARQVLPTRSQERAAAGDVPVASRSLDAYSFTRRERTKFAVVDRASLGADGALAGPAIVLEPTTTTYVDAGFSLRIGAAGAMIIERSEDPS